MTAAEQADRAYQAVFSPSAPRRGDRAAEQPASELFAHFSRGTSRTGKTGRSMHHRSFGSDGSYREARQARWATLRGPTDRLWGSGSVVAPECSSHRLGWAWWQVGSQHRWDPSFYKAKLIDRAATYGEMSARSRKLILSADGAYRPRVRRTLRGICSSVGGLGGARRPIRTRPPEVWCN